jgi:hypothetical protein
MSGLGAVYVRSVTSRVRTVAMGVIGLSLLFAFGMVVYRDVDMSLFDGFPESLMSVIGLAPGADVASLSYNAIFSTYGSLVLGGIAITVGAGAVAGRERDGTIGILLANPISRSRLVVESTLALQLLEPGPLRNSQLGLGATMSVAVLVRPFPQRLRAHTIGLGDFPDRLGSSNHLLTQLVLKLLAEPFTCCSHSPDLTFQ